MNWLVNFANDFLGMANYLVRLMNTPIAGLDDIFGTAEHPVTFLTMLSFLLIDYILAMFILRIVRG